MSFLAETIGRLTAHLNRSLAEVIVAAEVSGAAGVLGQMPTSASAAVPPAAPVPPVIVPPAPPAVPPGGGGISQTLFPDGAPQLRLPVLDEAIEVLEESPVFTAADYRTVSEQAREGAFAITSDLEQEAVEEIRSLLAENLREGADAKRFAEQVNRRLDTGGGLSEAHVDQVFRNNTHTALSNGADRAAKHPLVADAFPYRAYNATIDQRVRREHLHLERSGLNGTNIYRADDPVFNEFRPPWSWNCRCSWIALSVRQAARRGVAEAAAWWERAEALANEQGGRPEQYLSRTMPTEREFVDWPTLDGQRIEVDPNWQRRN